MTPSLLVLALLAARPAPAPAPPAARPPWASDAMPLPLAVRSPEDLAFKALAERQYLLFNLLASGKAAWDAGDFATAAEKWEALLRLPNLPMELNLGVRPFAVEARKRAGGQSAQPVAVAAQPVEEPESRAEAREEKREPSSATVRGTVSGGGTLGPGGTVVWLERKDGPTPRPKPARNKAILQRNKSFVPRVLAVPVGTTVEFRNEDDLFHNVFSLSRPNDFDLGLYKQGNARTQTFDAPGPVQLLCNIHAQMLAWVYVVKSPWYAQADGAGQFAIKGVPPGEYVLHAWSEGAAHPLEQPLKVTAELAPLALTVGGDASAPAFVPDKYGKPRQVQLGY